MEVHNELGHGFLEIVYKDALEYVFNQDEIFYEREKPYIVKFRDIILPHKFYADFVEMGKNHFGSEMCKNPYRRAYRSNHQLSESFGGTNWDF